MLRTIWQICGFPRRKCIAFAHSLTVSRITSQSHRAGQIAEPVLEHARHDGCHAAGLVHRLANFRDVQVLARRGGISAEGSYMGFGIVRAPHPAWRNGLFAEAFDALDQVHLERLKRDPAGPVAEPRVEFILQRDQRLDSLCPS